VQKKGGPIKEEPRVRLPSGYFSLGQGRGVRKNIGKNGEGIKKKPVPGEKKVNSGIARPSQVRKSTHGRGKRGGQKMTP